MNFKDYFSTKFGAVLICGKMRFLTFNLLLRFNAVPILFLFGKQGFKRLLKVIEFYTMIFEKCRQSTNNFIYFKFQKKERRPRRPKINFKNVVLYINNLF